MKKAGDWDNPNERGKRDRIWLSRTEYWEMDHFIEHYCESRGWGSSEKNKTAFRQAINAYTGAAPIKRMDLEKHLDEKWPPPKKP